MVLIFPPEPSKECVKVSHVIFECRVINHHPVLHVQILDAYCTSIFRLITVIFTEHSDLVVLKKHVKFHQKRTIDFLRYSASKFMEIVKIFARANFSRM